jgi:hypothetical protein
MNKNIQTDQKPIQFESGVKEITIFDLSSIKIGVILGRVWNFITWLRLISKPGLNFMKPGYFAYEA